MTQLLGHTIVDHQAAGPPLALNEQLGQVLDLGLHEDREAKGHTPGMKYLQNFKLPHPTRHVIPHLIFYLNYISNPRNTFVYTSP